jgi:hypothetical protein
MDLTTPALLFPAISLLLLAYTNRFLALATLTRSLHKDWRESGSTVASRQIKSLGKRLRLIRFMQMYGISSFGMCTLSMFAVFMKQILVGEIIFGLSLLTLMVSLFCSLREISLSNQALNIQLQDMDDSTNS